MGKKSKKARGKKQKKSSEKTGAPESSRAEKPAIVKEANPPVLLSGDELKTFDDIKKILMRGLVYKKINFNVIKKKLDALALASRSKVLNHTVELQGRKSTLLTSIVLFFNSNFPFNTNDYFELCEYCMGQPGIKILLPIAQGAEKGKHLLSQLIGCSGRTRDQTHVFGQHKPSYVETDVCSDRLHDMIMNVVTREFLKVAAGVHGNPNIDHDESGNFFYTLSMSEDAERFRLLIDPNGDFFPLRTSDSREEINRLDNKTYFYEECREIEKIIRLFDSDFFKYEKTYSLDQHSTNAVMQLRFSQFPPSFTIDMKENVSQSAIIKFENRLDHVAFLTISFEVIGQKVETVRSYCYQHNLSEETREALIILYDQLSAVITDLKNDQDQARVSVDDLFQQFREEDGACPETDPSPHKDQATVSAQGFFGDHKSTPDQSSVVDLKTKNCH